VILAVMTMMCMLPLVLSLFPELAMGIHNGAFVGHQALDLPAPVAQSIGGRRYMGLGSGDKVKGSRAPTVLSSTPHMHDAKWWPMQDLLPNRAMLVLVRHGQSEWNYANRFIGWYDSPLTEEGEWEAEEAGRLLADHNIEVDEVHVSMLDRCLSTARIALSQMRESGLHVPDNDSLRTTWRLIERSYGALTGRNKKECTKEYGKDQLKLWRRSWDIPPPQFEGDCELYSAETSAFNAKVANLSAIGLFDAEADPPPELPPRGESLKLTYERVIPYWQNVLLPTLQEGKRVMVFGHENNLRALVKHLDGISNEDILEVDIPRAMPMVYMFDKNELVERSNGLQSIAPVTLTPDDAPEGSERLSSRYLVDSALISAFHKRDMMNVYDTTVEENLEEVCIIDEEGNGDMCMVIDEYMHDPSENTDQSDGSPRKYGETVFQDSMRNGTSKVQAPTTAFLGMGHMPLQRHVLPPRFSAKESRSNGLPLIVSTVVSLVFSASPFWRNRRTPGPSKPLLVTTRLCNVAASKHEDPVCAECHDDPIFGIHD